MTPSAAPKKVYVFLFLLIALTIMVFPFGVAMPKGTTGGEVVENWFGYFSPIPLSAGNFLPAAAGVLTIFCMLLVLVMGKLPVLRKVFVLCAALSVLCSLLSWLIFGTFTPGSLAAVVFQLFALALALWEAKTQG